MEIVIIGCTHAGAAAAQAILHAHPEHHVTVIERHADITFLACGIALYLKQAVHDLAKLHHQTPDDLRKLGATVLMQHAVTRINVAARRVYVSDLTSQDKQVLHYDRLIMATGAKHTLPNNAGQHVMLCKDEKQAAALVDSAQAAASIALIGGGYVGVELAESYAQTGHNVTIYESGKQLLGNYLDAANAATVADRLAQHGVVLHLNTQVRAFEETANCVGIRTKKGLTEYDPTVATTGFTPTTELVANQLTCDRHGALVVNAYGQTSMPDVYAAGDCRTSLFNPTGQTAYVPLASAALRQGYLAGLNACGEHRRDFGTQASSGMLLFGLCVVTTGLTLTNAQKVVGLRPQAITWQGLVRPAFMPDPQALTVTLVYDRLSRRLLGAQLLSEHEVAQSANTLSLAIQNNNTIDDLVGLDTLFSPHFNQPENFLNQAALQAVRQEQEAGYQTPQFTALGAFGRKPADPA
ncbi:NAD(P)/FAD-dependent oxidoreductase [Lacticaseibacillus jixiensis]|uniref:NAD(P)/FAD-dependent oxidoreductase n=1 Tax=Lacticaseibacillus jixiensis TaxID=3231926 RepID=UPI0036F3F407